MYLTGIGVSLSLASGLVGFAGADSSGVITSTRIFNNFQGGEPLTFITTVTPSATALAPLPSGVFLNTAPGNHAPPMVDTKASSSLPPGVFLTTVPAVYTLSSSEVPSPTITTTNFATSTLTVTEMVQTVTIPISEVSAKPTLVTGLCYWGQGGVEIPCTYTANNIPNNISPTAIYASNDVTRTNGSQIIISTPSSAAISNRVNPVKFLVDGVKSMASRDFFDPSQVDWNALINATRNDNSSDPASHKHSSFLWNTCDRVPVLWAPIPIAILFFSHGIFLSFKWHQPGRTQTQVGRQVLLFVVFWGLAYPAFFYFEMYTSLASAWKECMPKTNSTLTH